MEIYLNAATTLKKSCNEQYSNEEILFVTIFLRVKNEVREMSHFSINYPLLEFYSPNRYLTPNLRRFFH